MEEGKKARKKKKKRSTAFKIFKISIITIFSLIFLIGIAVGGIVLAIIKTAPPLDVNAILSLSEPSKLYDSSEKYMDDLVTDEKRTIVSIQDVPDNLKNAIVSIEDERFYKHKGIDLRRISSVVYADAKNMLTGSHELQGASTLTQQLLKNTVLSSEVTAKRKIQEMYLAVQLEKKLTKDQILEAYMNTIPLGGRVYGVEAAANYYFSKSAKGLSLIECAYIAGVTQSPTRYNAFMDADKKDPSIYLTRTKSVISKMYENGYITKEQHDKAMTDLSNGGLKFNQSVATNNRMNYEWFSLPAIEQVKKDLKAQYNYNDSEINSLLMYGGLKIYTTMDRNLQDTAQKVLNDDKSLTSISKTVNGILQPQASAVVMDYHTGEVKAIIGGRGNQPPRSYNRAAYNGSKEFLRPTGSSIKPLTVYSPAIDTKAATAATVVEDSPLPEEVGKLYPDANGKPYNPRNYETGSFRGYVTVREAIESSINLVAIKLENQIGLKTGATYGEKFGLTFDQDDKTSIAALSLGQLHHGANTMTMAAAYGTFGNDGMYTDARLYTKVVDRNNVTILESKTTNKKILSPQSAYIMYDLLKGPTGPNGTAPNARFSSMPVVGKTGTSGDKKDFWFAGLTPYYSAAVWVGDDTPKTYETGLYSSTSAGLWSKIMAEAHKNLAVKDIDQPSGIQKALVCRDSGDLPTDLCAGDPRGNQEYTEIFADGTVPTTFCDVHVEAKINKANGKLATEYTPQDLIESRIFIKRNYVPTVPLGDQPYVLPTEYDDSKPGIEPQPPTTGTEPPTPPTNPTTEPPTNPTVPPVVPSH